MTGPTDPSYPGPQDPQYPQQSWNAPYPSQHPYGQYPQQPPAPPRGQLWERMAHRVAARPAPRLGITLAGIGVGLALFGVVIWGISYVTEGQLAALEAGAGSGSDSRHFTAAVLALIVTVLGYVVAARARRGPLATAGVAASALGVPVTIEFLTLDVTGGNPINTDAVVWVSVIVYLISYAVVRGTRGHTFYLGLTLLFIWEYAVEKTAPAAGDFVGGAASQFIPGAEPGSTPHVEFGTVGGVSLVIGIVYYLLAWSLDRAGRQGAGVAFALIGFLAVGVGIGALSQELKQVGTGVVLIVAGLLLGMYGARYDRRFTTWIWAVAAAFGAVLILAKIVTHGGTAVGIGFIVLGAIFVVGGCVVARATNEPDDLPEPAPV